MPITLQKDTTKKLHASIKRYAAENFGEEIGDLKAALMLEFFLKEIGPSVYNQAIADAQAFFQERTADLGGICYEKEFTYWLPQKGDRKK